ncbi:MULTISPECIES: Cna B-type domain-containing protein, partial [Terrabacteria group]|uniref:Cna B-type domain-containing protein n=1 Tax=Bacillati TaxID=1783272 RepID=UPI001C6DDFBF
TKKWVGKEGTSATVHLLADGQKVAGVTLNKANHWQHTFTNLEQYKNGNEIKYTVEEEKMPLYDSNLQGNAKDGFIITNTHVPPKKEVFTGGTTTNIDGKKVNPGQELTYSITYKNTKGKEVDAVISDKVPAHTEFVSADNGGQYANGIVKWTKKLAHGESWTVSFKVKVVDDVNGEELRNKAKVNDGTNEYDTNETHNPTPTEPKKEVFTGGTTTNINGQAVQPGQELTYAVTYKNTTGKDVKATISDTIPAHTSFVSAENGGQYENGKVTWTADVAKDKSVTVKFTVKVDKDVNGAPLTNKAKVNDGTNEYDTNETHNPTPTEPKKEVFTGGTTTNIDGKKVNPSDELTYAITYKNTTGEERDVTITDKLPKHTTFVSADNNGKYENGMVKWTKKLANGESWTVSFKVKVVDDVNGEELRNKAKVNDGENEYDTNETHNPTPTEPKKEVFTGGTTTNIDGKAVQPGQELTYAVTYKNTTGKDVKATISDTIPAHTSFVSAENGGQYANGKVTWTADVEKGKSVTVKFTVKVDKDVNGTPVDNKAKVNDGENEYDTNETHNPTPTDPKKEVFTGGTTTNIDGKAVQPGQELTYAVTYKNTTGKDVKATISDTIPAHTSFVSAENGGQYANGKVTWTADVAKDKSVTVKFTVKVNKDVNGAPVDNKAKVNDGENDYDTNETHNPTPTEPKKEVFTGGTTTNIDGKKVNPGDKLTYAITYKNTTGEEREVSITDKLPKHTEFVSADNNGKYENGMVKWTKKLAHGESWTVKFTVKVNKDVNGATLTNTARVNDGVNDYDTNTVKNPTPKTPQVPNTPTPKNSPRTGDSSNIALLFMMLLASSAGLGVTYMRRKRV